MKRYLIFRIDFNNLPYLIHSTTDYYYVRRLYKRYKEVYDKVFVKSIWDNVLFEYSTEEKIF